MLIQEHPAPGHRFLTVGEAAKMLGVSRETLRNWDRSGKLCPVRHPMNGYRLYHPDEIKVVMRQLGPAGAFEQKITVLTCEVSPKP